jgi:hypothetical protein
MSNMAESPRASRSRARLARAALCLYPPAWRARYGEEIAVLLEDSRGGLAAVVSLAWRAVPAWVWPPRHLYNREARMRASLATLLVAGAVLTGAGLVFAQLTQFQGFWLPEHPIIGFCYAIFDAAMAVSAFAAIGGVPLWLVMLRRARREHRARETAYLLLPIAVPATYLSAVLILSRLVRGPDGIGAGWFLAVTCLGFVAAGLSCAGPILAMNRLRPRGPAVRLAAVSAGIAATTIVLASAASAIAATGLCLWARHFAGFHQGGVLGAYLAVVGGFAAVAAVSAIRGVRATLARPGS